MPDRDGHAVQDAAQHLGLRGQADAGSALAGAGDPPGHLARRDEDGILHVDKRQPGREPGGRAGQLVQVDVPSAVPPFPCALLQQPEPGDVAQEPGGPVDTGLVAEACFARGVGDDRCRELDADYRQVPVQTKAKSSPAVGTAATAAAVSCDGATIT